MKYLVTVDAPDSRQFIIDAVNDDELKKIICSDIGCADYYPFSLGCTYEECTWDDWAETECASCGGYRICYLQENATYLCDGEDCINVRYLQSK